MQMKRIGVLGGGAWATALAISLHKTSTGKAADGPIVTHRKTGNDTPTNSRIDVPVWLRNENIAAAMRAGQGNPVYLPDIATPKLDASTDLAHLAGCDAILAVIPVQASRAVFSKLSRYISENTPILLCSKGIEQNTLNLMSDILHETIPQAIPAILSGPSFAIDVARNLPTAVTLACDNEKQARTLVSVIGHSGFRPYWSNDMIGAEIGGAVKNVLAIACGIVEGCGLGRSAHASLIARGFAEMTRLGSALGARPETLTGLCGLGDLVLTCSSPRSRNMHFGKTLGEGSTVEQALHACKSVTEGVFTAPAIAGMAEKHGVEMPICMAVNAILAGKVGVLEAIDGLLMRPYKPEWP